MLECLNFLDCLAYSFEMRLEDLQWGQRSPKLYKVPEKVVLHSLPRVYQVKCYFIGSLIEHHITFSPLLCLVTMRTILGIVE
jgi:hypothetical protein